MPVATDGPYAEASTMTMAKRTDPRSPPVHVEDSHDLIRVHGARVNNLKDISIDIPKRRRCSPASPARA